MTQPSKHTAKKKLVSPITIAIIVLAALGIFAGWYFLKDLTKTPTPSGQATKLAPAPPAIPPGPATQETKGTPSAQAPAEPETAKAPPCEQTAEGISSFFSSLDKADYIRMRKLQGGSQRYFRLLIDKLLAKPPVVARERESLTAILQNTSHFYRALGKNNISLIKEILAREGEALEPDMALFYRWSELAPKCGTAKGAVHLPLPGLYEYAGFFLNTLGGQSYLFRRESRVRMLVKYYSILILDRANDASLNRYGIDIRPSLDSLLEEMKTTTRLAGRDTYLVRLILLRDKYLARYGAKTPAPSGSR